MNLLTNSSNLLWTEDTFHIFVFFSISHLCFIEYVCSSLPWLSIFLYEFVLILLWMGYVFNFFLCIYCIEMQLITNGIFILYDATLLNLFISSRFSVVVFSNISYIYMIYSYVYMIYIQGMYIYIIYIYDSSYICIYDHVIGKQKILILLFWIFSCILLSFLIALYRPSSANWDRIGDSSILALFIRVISLYIFSYNVFVWLWYQENAAS
jgi:hypothetical protein